MTWLKDMWLSSRKGTRRLFLLGVFLLLLFFVYRWNGETPIF
jgi:hypothetical protein